jgi:hypothetical protein
MVLFERQRSSDILAELTGHQNDSVKNNQTSRVMIASGQEIAERAPLSRMSKGNRYKDYAWSVPLQPGSCAEMRRCPGGLSAGER